MSEHVIRRQAASFQALRPVEDPRSSTSLTCCKARHLGPTRSSDASLPLNFPNQVYEESVAQGTAQCIAEDTVSRAPKQHGIAAATISDHDRPTSLALVHRQ